MKKLLPVVIAILVLFTACGSYAQSKLALDAYVSFMDEKMVENQMPTFSAVAPSDADEVDDKLKYDYFVDSYNLICIYTDKNSNRITQINIYAVSRSAPQNELDIFGYICGLTLGYIDPKEAQTIGNELCFTDIVNTGTSLAESDTANYMYMVDDGLTMIIDIK